MTPMQQILLGVGAKKKTYMDDVFSTYLYTGDASTQTINNAINLSGEGGLVWAKKRGSAGNHMLTDTVRGNTKRIESSSTDAETTANNVLNSFNSNGFTVGYENPFNQSGEAFASWCFRRAKGFFDIVTYTGSGSARTIAHSLGSVPGCIMVKCTSESQHWAVFHCGIDSTSPEDYYMRLNESQARTNNTYWNDTAPTATEFSLGIQDTVNGNNKTYVAYIFAGGESTSSLAKSIELDGSNDYFQTSASTDFEFSGNFTFECWFHTHTVSGNRGIFNLGNSQQEGGFEVYISNKTLKVDDAGTLKFTTSDLIDMDQWYHIAFVRSGISNRLYLNGVDVGGYTTSNDYGINSGGNRSYFMMGTGYNGSVEHFFDGNISNVRVLNGTALYTSSFRPPIEPLTNITNTKLLCCNNSSVTGSTVAPTTLTASGTVASTKHPFDAPGGFVFGDAEDQNVIKCGSYTGNGSATGPEINLGWEPQWIMIKPSSLAVGWSVYDSMRGIVTGGNDSYLYPNANNDEEVDYNQLDLTSTGFKINSTGSIANSNGNTYVYMCIRRPDGYVGKPADAGTGVFAMDTGAGGSTIPQYDSGFPVDFALRRQPAASSNWILMGRLIQGKYLMTNSSNAEQSNSNIPMFDSNVGFSKTDNNTHQGWMWKRGAGFDLVSYDGQTNILNVPHSLNAVPEMIWVKARTGTAAQNQNWKVYHKGLNGGTTPQNYYLSLNGTGAENTNANSWNNTAPTSTHFTLGSGDAEVNYNNYTFLAMLFASVDGISKCGYFDGSDSEQTITTGFQPRLLILKSATGTGENWYILDTTRGWASGNDTALWLNTNHAQWSSANYGAPTSTGFTLPGNHAGTNDAGQKYIYYAHA